MKSLLQEEYFHFGTDKIFYELWHNIYMLKNTNYPKPLGGLWTSHQNKECLCEWLKYIENKNRNNFDYYVGQKKSCLVKFKENINFLKIEDKQDWINLEQSGFIKKLSNPMKIRGVFDYIYIDEILDYEKITEYYDLIYVDYFIHDCLNQFSVNTMLALNPNSIEYYKPLIVDYLNHTIVKIGDKEYIKPSKDYFKFLKYVKDRIDNIKVNNFEEFLNNINQIKREIIEDLINNFDFRILNLPENLDRDHLVYATVTNELTKKLNFTK